MSYDPLNPEHEATGWVLWVNSTICVTYHYLRPSSRMKKYENYQDPIFTCLQELLQGCLQPDI
jgi:hypothetical protein